MSSPDDANPKPEPMFNAPWPPLALAATVMGCFLLQVTLAPEAWRPFAFSPVLLGTDRSWTMLTTQFLHGGWTHVMLAVAWIVVFGTPVARLFGDQGRGVAAFFIYYLLCGSLGVWGLGLAHPGNPNLALGSSAAIAALMGGASRLIGTGGKLGPVLARAPLGFAGAWVLLNLLIVLIGRGLGGLGFQTPWEAHLIGFFSGMLLIGPFARLARPVYRVSH